jgi:hypothetical protein
LTSCSGCLRARPTPSECNPLHLLHRYHVALAKNPRCIVLWRKYLDWLKKELIKSDPNYLREQIENALKIVSNHYKAAFVFEDYCEVEPNIVKRYHMLKKAMVSPLEDIDRIRELFLAMVEGEEFGQAIAEIAESEEIQISQQGTPEDTRRLFIEEVKARINTLYEPTKQHISQCQVFEKKVYPCLPQISTDEYIPYTDSIENWRQYIAFIKQSGNSEFLPSVYERALISQCDSATLWE